MDTIICTVCSGRGEVDLPINPFEAVDNIIYELGLCPTCHGKGQISHRTYERYLYGDPKAALEKAILAMTSQYLKQRKELDEN